MLEEHVDELPHDVVGRLDQLLGHERVADRRDELQLGADWRECHSKSAAPRSRGERHSGGCVGAEANRDVCRLGRELNALAQQFALTRERQCRECPLADDHGVHELDGNVVRVRARLGRAREGEQPSSAGKALGGPVTEPRQRVGDLLEVPPACLRAQRQQLIDAVCQTSVVGALARPACRRGHRDAHAGCASARATSESQAAKAATPSPVRALTSMCSTPGLTRSRFSRKRSSEKSR